jgi:hypothetical protein
MDWPAELITRSLAVCQHWQEVGWVPAQRYAPYADESFTDAEVVTLYRFAVGMEQKRQIKAIHQHARRYWRDRRSGVLRRAGRFHARDPRPAGASL